MEENHNSPNELKLVSISDFVNENESLLQVFGVFAGLVLFASVIKQSLLSAIFSFLFFAMTILVGQEVRSKVPQNGTFTLRLLTLLLTFSLYCLFIYWLVGFVDIWESGAMTYLLLFAWFVLFVRVFDKVIEVLGYEGFVFRGEKLKRKRQGVGYFILLGLAFVIFGIVSLQIPKLSPIGVELIKIVKQAVVATPVPPVH